MRPTPLRPRTDNGGGRAAGSLTPQLPECAEDGYPGKGPPCTRPAHSPVPPTLYCPVGKSVAGLLPRTFQRSRWGQNSGGTAAPVHHCPRWLSKPKKGLGGDIRRLSTRAPVITPPHHITQVCLCHKSTKNFCQVAHISPPSAAHSYCA